MATVTIPTLNVEAFYEVSNAMNGIKRYLSLKTADVPTIRQCASDIQLLGHHLNKLNDELAKYLSQPASTVIDKSTTVDKLTVTDKSEIKVELIVTGKPEIKSQPVAVEAAVKEAVDVNWGWNEFKKYDSEFKKGGSGIEDVLPDSMAGLPKMMNKRIKDENTWNDPACWRQLIRDMVTEQRCWDSFGDIDDCMNAFMPYSGIAVFYERFRSYWLTCSKFNLDYALQVSVDIDHVASMGDPAVKISTGAGKRLRRILFECDNWDDVHRVNQDEIDDKLQRQLKSAILKYYYAKKKCVDDAELEVRDQMLFKQWILCGGLSCVGANSLRNICDYKSWMQIKDDEIVDGLYFARYVAVEQFNHAYDAVMGKFDVNPDSTNSCEWWIDHFAEGYTPVSVTNILSSIK